MLFENREQIATALLQPPIRMQRFFKDAANMHVIFRLELA